MDDRRRSNRPSSIVYRQRTTATFRPRWDCVRKRAGMPQESLDQFRQLVLQDLALQEQLRETPNLDAFLALIVRLGAERGYDFGVEEVKEALRASQRTWIERWSRCCAGARRAWASSTR